jgi:hypothetical protein
MSESAAFSRLNTSKLSRTDQLADVIVSDLHADGVLHQMAVPLRASAGGCGL